jgi:hypothetical protein
LEQIGRIPAKLVYKENKYQFNWMLDCLVITEDDEITIDFERFKTEALFKEFMEKSKGVEINQSSNEVIEEKIVDEDMKEFEEIIHNKKDNN